MAHKRTVQFVTVKGDVYEFELTEALESNLLNIAAGYLPPSAYTQTHDEEWVNMDNIVSFAFHGSRPKPQPSGGGVFNESERDEVWKADQTGSVIIAEPDMMTEAREREES